MDALLSFYHGLPGGVRFAADFFFTVIVLRGIVANEINKEIRLYWARFRKQWHEFWSSENNRELWLQVKSATDAR